MAWDTEATRQKLLDAATEEFSARGFAGARIGEISRRSGCNRERIYWYFGDKVKLFEAVLTRHLVTALEGLPVEGTGPEALSDFAGRYFDISARHPGLARLTYWEGLERGQPVDLERRACPAAREVAEIQTALPGIGQEEAENLLLTIVTLCHSWVSTPNISAVLSAGSSDESRRSFIMKAVALVAADALSAGPLDMTNLN